MAAGHGVVTGSGAFPADAGGFYARHGKRVLDLLLVLLAVPVLIPVMLVCGALVRLDGGPAFYSQDRVGFGGRRFRLWKFRTMVVDADARLAAFLAENPAAAGEWNRTQKLRHDPRVTRVGRLLRTTSLDEIPQLWNVLLGDMSLVGPRPMMVSQTGLYPGRAYYRLRPGLTGFWQVSRRNETSFASRAHYDRSYAARISLLTDLRVMLATFRVVAAANGH